MAVCETQTGDWRDDKTLAECMRHMLKNEIMCDVTLRVGEGRTPIKAHKYMLASRSPVFHTMFEGSMPETGEINIPDIEENTFNDILVYIYTDNLEVTNSNVTELLYASDKYMLTKVKRECEKTLKKTATSEYAAKTLQTAYKYHLPDLLQESLQHIELNTKACLLSEHSLDLPKESVDIILKSDYLNCSETDLCQFFLKWAKAQCASQRIESTGRNMRDLVGQTLYQIRFPVVDMDFFSNEIANTDFLSSDEIIAIYRSQYGINTSNFTNNARGGPIEKRQVHTVTRYTDYSQIYECESEGTEALIFQTDTDIWLKGVNLFPYNYNAEITFKILDEINEEIIVHKTEIDGNYGYEAHLIKLPKPVVHKTEIDGNYEYEARLIKLPKPVVHKTEIDGNYEYEARLIKLPKPVKILSGKEYTITTQTYTGTSNMYYGSGTSNMYYGPSLYYGVRCYRSIEASDCDVCITFKNSPMCTGISNVDQGQFAGFTFSV